MSIADLRRTQSYLRVAAPRGRDHRQIGPFLATFSRDTDNPYLNYAIPDDDASPSQADVRALGDAYREHARMPRLEYVPAVAPAVEPALVAAGFAVENRTPLMVYTAGSAATRAPPAGVELLDAASDEELRGVAAVQWEAYEETGPLPDRVVAGLRRTLSAGGAVVLARDAATHDPAGGALCTGPHDGVTELTSVGVRESFRRRGIAEAMTWHLAQRMAARGCDRVFLMADNERIAKIYARAGFDTISEVLHIALRA